MRNITWHSTLPTAYCLLPIAYCLLPIAYCLLPVAYCLLPIAYCLPPTAYCLLPIAYQVITATGSHTTIANASGKTEMFTKSIAHRDDWLHRGEGLRDMDYYHYARYIERVEKPRKGTAHAFQKRHGVYHLFDNHYSLARSYVQVLLKHPKTVQNVGPQCKRNDVNQGEDNAVYKAYFHSCIQCTGLTTVPTR